MAFFFNRTLAPCHHLLLFSVTPYLHVTSQKGTNHSSKREATKHIYLNDASYHKFNHKRLAEEINKQNIWVSLYLSKMKLAHHVHVFFYKQICFHLHTEQKMKFSIKDFFSILQVTFTEEILNGKVHFLCSVKLIYA